jgi:FMN-dependent NADH-azoreductase
MKILHVDSSIAASNSVSRQLSQALVDKLMMCSSDVTVVYLDVVADPLPHLTSDIVVARTKQREVAPETLAALMSHEAALQAFLAADLVIIGAPMYNFNISSQLKAWVDTLAVPGRTFRYRSDRTPEGLCKGKRVVLISSRGNVYSAPSAFAKLDHQEAYLIDFFTFLAVDRVDVIRAEGIGGNPGRREHVLAATLDAIAGLTFE